MVKSNVINYIKRNCFVETGHIGGLLRGGRDLEEWGKWCRFAGKIMKCEVSNGGKGI